VESASALAQLPLRFVDRVQWRYELIRPLVLFDEGTPTQRAQETPTHPDTVRTFMRRFRQQGCWACWPTTSRWRPAAEPAGCPELCGRKLRGSKLSTLYGQNGRI
jgi:hypothetical protein